MPEKELIITVKESSQEVAPDITSIALRGSIDTYTYGELEQALNNLFNQKQYKIIIDMSQVNYISSVGVGILVGAISTAQENMGNIVLMHPKPEVREVFNLLGLTQGVTITDSMSSALKAFI